MKIKDIFKKQIKREMAIHKIQKFIDKLMLKWLSHFVRIEPINSFPCCVFGYEPVLSQDSLGRPTVS